MPNNGNEVQNCIDECGIQHQHQSGKWLRNSPHHEHLVFYDIAIPRIQGIMAGSLTITDLTAPLKTEPRAQGSKHDGRRLMAQVAVQAYDLKRDLIAISTSRYEVDTPRCCRSMTSCATLRILPYCDLLMLLMLLTTIRSMIVWLLIYLSS
jgi:hypothetical protein